jgi:hypothetical protein
VTKKRLSRWVAWSVGFLALMGVGYYTLRFPHAYPALPRETLVSSMRAPEFYGCDTLGRCYYVRAHTAYAGTTQFPMIPTSISKHSKIQGVQGKNVKAQASKVQDLTAQDSKTLTHASRAQASPVYHFTHPWGYITDMRRPQTLYVSGQKGVYYPKFHTITLRGKAYVRTHDHQFYVHTACATVDVKTRQVQGHDPVWGGFNHSTFQAQKGFQVTADRIVLQGPCTLDLGGLNSQHHKVDLRALNSQHHKPKGVSDAKIKTPKPMSKPMPNSKGYELGR